VFVLVVLQRKLPIFIKVWFSEDNMASSKGWLKSKSLKDSVDTGIESNRNWMHSQRVTVWYAFWAEDVTELYFSENEDCEAITVNWESYRTMINHFLCLTLVDIDLENLWFQQDGASCHTTKETMILMCSEFQDRIISKNCDVIWQPRSCDVI